MDTVNKIKSIHLEFIDYFKSEGYRYVPPEPLFPSEDKTVAFTNATIIPLKKYLNQPYAVPGFVVYQPCLRLRNLDSDNYNPQFTSFFRMVSILSHPDVELDKVQKIISRYLAEILQIPSDKIILHYSTKVIDLVSDIWKEDYKLEKGNFSEDFYSWTYGMEGVIGRGITFFVETTYGPRELGNFVEITTNGVLSGYEFGFGIESAICIIDNYKNNFSVLFPSHLNSKLIDLTCSRGVIFQELASNKGHGIISSSARSCIKKIDHELAYSILEYNEGNCSYISAINWELCGVQFESVKQLKNYLESKIMRIKKSAKLVDSYKKYLKTMMSSGKSELWAKVKMEEYIKKNNYKRITDLMAKKVIL